MNPDIGDDAMKCSTVRDLLTGFLDRTLPIDIAASIAEHLKECMACDNDRLEVEKAGKFIAIGVLSPVWISNEIGGASIIGEVMKAVRQSPENEETGGSFLYFTGIFKGMTLHPVGVLAVAACVLLIFSVFLTQSGPGPAGEITVSATPVEDAAARIAYFKVEISDGAPDAAADRVLVEAMYDEIEKEILLDQFINEFKEFNFDRSHLEFDKFITTAGY